MKSTNILSTICAIAIIATAGTTTAFAASANGTSNEVISSQSSVQADTSGKDSKRNTALKGKIAALTESQKSELQAIRAQGEGSRDAHIDKLLEFGVIDQATATQMKAKTEQNRGGEGKEKPALTAEQIAEKQANKAALESKIAALTDTQKSELDTIKAQGKGSRSSYVDKLLEFGVIDQATATKMKERPAPKNSSDNTSTTAE